MKKVTFNSKARIKAIELGEFGAAHYEEAPSKNERVLAITLSPHDGAMFETQKVLRNYFSKYVIDGNRLIAHMNGDFELFRAIMRDLRGRGLISNDQVPALNKEFNLNMMHVSEQEVWDGMGI